MVNKINIQEIFCVEKKEKKVFCKNKTKINISFQLIKKKKNDEIGNFIVLKQQQKMSVFKIDCV